MAVLLDDNRVGVGDLIGRLDALAAEVDSVLASGLEGDRGGVDIGELRALIGAARRLGRSAGALVTRAGLVARRCIQTQGEGREGHTQGSSEPVEPASEGRGGEGDRGNGAGAGGFGVFADLMNPVGGRDKSSTGRREALRVETCASFPLVAGAFQDGRIGPDQLDIIGRAAKRLDHRAEAVLNTAEVVEEAAWLPADTFERRLQRRVTKLIDGETRQAEANAKHDRSEVKSWFDESAGMGKILAVLDPERFEAVTGAIEQHANSLAATTGGSKGPNLAARALCELVTGSGVRSANLPHITVVVDADGEAETADGHPLSPAAVNRLVCDSVVRRVTLDDHRVPVDVGRAYRTATGAQWAALKATYSRCGWPGCTAPISWCQAHHIHYWEQGGRTDLGNLIPLCSHHHHMVHDRGWKLRLRNTDRRLSVYRPRADGAYEMVAQAHPDRNQIQTE